MSPPPSLLIGVCEYSTKNNYRKFIHQLLRQVRLIIPRTVDIHMRCAHHSPRERRIFRADNWASRIFSFRYIYDERSTHNNRVSRDATLSNFGRNYRMALCYARNSFSPLCRRLTIVDGVYMVRRLTRVPGFSVFSRPTRVRSVFSPRRWFAVVKIRSMRFEKLSRNYLVFWARQRARVRRSVSSRSFARRHAARAAQIFPDINWRKRILYFEWKSFRPR